MGAKRPLGSGAERQQVSHTGPVNTRIARYPEYRALGLEGLASIPAHWNARRLRYLSRLNPPASEIRGMDGSQEISFIPMEAIGEGGGLDLSGTRRLDDVSAGYSYFRDGDVVVAKITPCFENGKAAVAAGLVAGVAFGTTELHVLRPFLVDARFLFYMVQSAQFRKLGEAEMYGAGGQKRVPESFVLDFICPLPPADEQRAITAFLDLETARIDALLLKLGTLRELVQERSATALENGVNAGGGSGNWESARLRHLMNRVIRPVKVLPDGDYRELGLRSWGRGIFHKDPVRGALLDDKLVFSIEPGDLVLNIVFAWEGAVALAREADVGLVGSHRFPTFCARPGTDKEFLALLLRSERGRKLMEVNSPGAAGRNKTIRIGQFLSEEVQVPCLEEQGRIVSRVSREISLADKTDHKLDRCIGMLRELRVGLISAAVTGQIDVREDAA